MVVLATASHSLRSGGGSGKKKDQDAADVLPLLAVRCIASVLQQCTSMPQLQRTLSALPPHASATIVQGVQSSQPLLAPPSHL